MKHAFLAAVLALPGPACAQYAPLTEALGAMRAAVSATTDAPDAFDENDGFRQRLLDPARSDRWLVPTALGEVLLVVEKGYIGAAALDRVASDLREAAAAIPRLTGREPRVRGRFTVYVYDEGPMSEAGVPGASRGEKAVMLRFVREEEDPLFHELTHLLAGFGDSQSLDEGIAEWVQARLRPGRAAGLIAAGTDPHRKAAEALAAYPPGFRETIGAPGFYRWSGAGIRTDFYHCSWSFVDFLLRRGGMKNLYSVIDAGGAPAAYRAAFGRTYDDLFADWVRDVSGRASVR